MNNNSWMNDPALKNIDPMKLQILSSIANEAGNKNTNELLPFFMSAMNQANDKGISFSSPERELLMNILMQKLAPEERQKAETIIRMASAFQKK
ncbi:MAG: hypothetical protein HFI75_14885 [Lachnospiraceae bacterium]|nr:hypothetical protein [Lachnospiraceae bacterium]